MTKGSRIVVPILLALAMIAGTVTPALSQTPTRREIERRQQKKNEWRNIATAAGAIGIYGLLKNDKTLFFAGTAGALYSLHRYEQDRKSHSKLRRLRAEYFSRSSFTRDGVRYVRRTTTRNGKKYYYFTRAR